MSIPVSQLWDVGPRSYKDETKKAARFLYDQQWPINKKYISVYNEMNDARFWRGNLDPEGYAEVLDYTIDTFKSLDKNFFMLNGAFNSTAPEGGGYMDQLTYMRKMNDSVQGIFLKLDGWASHSYPQPGFIGKPDDSGRGSVKAYDWELSILKYEFAVGELPVFVTETGWPHSQGERINPSYYDEETSADFIRRAFENVWLKDERVVAVTPFTIYYGPPFDHFSWIKKDGGVYKQFEVIKGLSKVAGRPPVLNEIEKEVISCP